MPDVPMTRYASAGTGEVAYQVVGDGPLDVIFVPSWETNVEIIWEHPLVRRFLLRLASFSRLIVFDKRGTGVSGPIPLNAIPTLEQWTDDIGTVLAAVGSERAALFGHGAGGQMAMLFAASHPERASALVLLDTHARFVRAPDYPAGLPEHSVEPFMGAFRANWGTLPSAAVAAPRADEQLLRWFARLERLAMSPSMAAAAFDSVVINTDIRPILEVIRVPTLVMHRRDNQFVRIGHGRYVADHIRGATLVEVEGDEYIYWLGDTDAILNATEEFLTGRLHEADTDRVLATVLFTDIVGSTERAARVGDRAWRDLLDRHHEVVRHELVRFSGKEIDTAGDGFLATFDGPGRAIRCARSIVEGARAIGLEIRAGLHTGEIELAGDDVRGIAIHIGARVSALASSSEVLVSSTVKDLVAGSGIEFEDRGAHMLKGLPSEWRLFAAISG